jgi:DNA-directed RNA polymerase subunit RPC12/RpoP
MGRELSKNTRPQMFETDRTAEKSKLVKLDEADDDAMKSYYKNLQLRCVKCDGSFQHKADLPLVEYEIKCPHCSESHILKFKPTSRLFTMQSSSVELLGQKEK